MNAGLAQLLVEDGTPYRTHAEFVPQIQKGGEHGTLGDTNLLLAMLPGGGCVKPRLKSRQM